MGRVPRVQSPDTFGNYSALGPMSRDARDLATMLSIISGAARDDAASLRGPPFLTDEAVEKERPLRVGWIADPGGYAVDREVQTLTFEALEALRDARLETISIDGEFLHGVFGAYRVIAAVGHAAWARNQTESDRALASESYRRIVAHGGSYSAVELTVAQEERTSLFRAVQTVFDSVDVIATPSLTAPPKTVDAEGSVDSDSFAVWAAALYPFNLTGHPALSVPCGFTAAGLPVGLQLVAPWGGEARLLSLAATMEVARPWTAQRPNL
jgi:aspartyl-tRNA(Asn)/glutamyl-tRNA(Gln) amidotransferase subunit A